MSRTAVGAVVVAIVACCISVLTATGGGDGDEDGVTTSRAADATLPRVPDAAPDRAVAPQPVASDAVPVLVEIDDAPLPAGATATIRGTVRDDLGRPIADARVSAIVFYELLTMDLPVPAGGARTVADGRYLIDGLDPSIVWRLEASADGHAEGPTARAVAVSSRRLDATYDFVLPRNGSIHAVVLDAAGAPIQGHVRVYEVDDEDDDGWGLDASSLFPGRYRVLVEAPGRASERRVLDVAAGDPTRAEFRLGESVEISGVLVDADGVLRERYVVVAQAEDEPRRRLAPSAVSAADGTFRFVGLRPARYRLEPADADLAADTPGAVLAPANGVRVQLRHKSKVTFRLVYPPDFTAADRAADVNVGLTVRGTTFRPSPRWDLDTGTVRVPGGEDVDLAITAIRCRTVHRRVNVRPGDVLDLGDIGPEEARDIAGRVVDANGTPVPQALVLHTAGGLERRTLSGDDGRFLVERLPRADTTIDVEARGYVPVRAECRVGAAEPLTVTLSRGGVLRVRCETRSGAAIPSAPVRILDARGAAWTFAPATLDGHGECAVRVPPAKWRVDVAGCDPATAEVRENATTSVRVRPREP